MILFNIFNLIQAAEETEKPEVIIAAYKRFDLKLLLENENENQCDFKQHMDDLLYIETYKDQNSEVIGNAYYNLNAKFLENSDEMLICQKCRDAIPHIQTILNLAKKNSMTIQKPIEELEIKAENSKKSYSFLTNYNNEVLAAGRIVQTPLFKVFTRKSVEKEYLVAYENGSMVLLEKNLDHKIDINEINSNFIFKVISSDLSPIEQIISKISSITENDPDERMKLLDKYMHLSNLTKAGDLGIFYSKKDDQTLNIQDCKEYLTRLYEEKLQSDISNSAYPDLNDPQNGSTENAPASQFDSLEIVESANEKKTSWVSNLNKFFKTYFRFLSYFYPKVNENVGILVLTKNNSAEEQPKKNLLEEYANSDHIDDLAVAVDKMKEDGTDYPNQLFKYPHSNLREVENSTSEQEAAAAKKEEDAAARKKAAAARKEEDAAARKKAAAAARKEEDAARKEEDAAARKKAAAAARRKKAAAAARKKAAAAARKKAAAAARKKAAAAAAREAAAAAAAAREEAAEREVERAAREEAAAAAREEAAAAAREEAAAREVERAAREDTAGDPTDIKGNAGVIKNLDESAGNPLQNISSIQKKIISENSARKTDKDLNDYNLSDDSCEEDLKKNAKKSEKTVIASNEDSSEKSDLFIKIMFVVISITVISSISLGALVYFKRPMTVE